jgi:hypothetical protein
MSHLSQQGKIRYTHGSGIGTQSGNAKVRGEKFGVPLSSLLFFGYFSPQVSLGGQHYSALAYKCQCIADA